MSDRLSLLTLPMLEVGDPETSAIGDPILDVLGDFLRTAVNADVGEGWRAVCPREPEPIKVVRTHNPDKSEFSDQDLPCLFLYRLAWPKLTPFSQDWKAQVSQIAALWVPDLETFEKDAIRDPMRNAIAKSIHRNIERGRNQAWFVHGDDEAKAEDYGSFLLRHINVAKIEVRDIKPFPLQVLKGEKNLAYDGLLATIEVTELMVAVLDDYDEIAGVQGGFQLGEPGLLVQAFDYRPSLTAVTPSGGPLVGGTAIALSGLQFFEDEFLGSIVVTIGGVPCTNVVWADEQTITATTPAGSSGAKEVKVTMPNGASASLASAFTYA